MGTSLIAQLREAESEAALLLNNLEERTSMLENLQNAGAARLAKDIDAIGEGLVALGRATADAVAAARADIDLIIDDLEDAGEYMADTAGAASKAESKASEAHARLDFHAFQIDLAVQKAGTAVERAQAAHIRLDSLFTSVDETAHKVSLAKPRLDSFSVRLAALEGAVEQLQTPWYTKLYRKFVARY